jgi:hypothetical protein
MSRTALVKPVDIYFSAIPAVKGDQPGAPGTVVPPTEDFRAELYIHAFEQ